MSGRRIQRVFVADRGEAALRVLRSARGAGMEVVVAVADEDGEAVWPDEADFSVFIPREDGVPWPSVDRVIAAAADAGCDAVHPGAGALQLRPDAPSRVHAASMAFVGAGTRGRELGADRAALRARCARLGLETVPGAGPFTDPALITAWVAGVGYPVLVKHARAAGVRRTVRANGAEELAVALDILLGQGPVFVERFVDGAREIEVPFLVDGHGEGVTLGDREICLREGADRLLVEAPAPGLSAGTRAAMREAVVRLAQDLGWTGLGLCRFLVTADGHPWLLAVRPGLQPGAAATEACLGVDLVDAELRLAEGDALGWSPADIGPERVALAIAARAAVADESRVEGILVDPGLRFDSAVVAGDLVVPGEALGTLVATGPTRQAAVVRARAALDTWPTVGVEPAVAAVVRLLEDPRFWRAPLDREAAAAVVADEPPALDPARVVD
jgi:acetyl/propionyl-CoA carboxylase alpha subunit